MTTIDKIVYATYILVGLDVACILILVYLENFKQGEKK